MKGTASLNDCNSFANGNTGCGVHGDSSRDFGPAYNQAGGGYWVTMRDRDEIKMWFWSRQDPDVPDVVKSGKAADSVDPDTFGTPTSHFTSDGACDIEDKFGKNTIVFNLTFCGAFAGHAFPGGTPACESELCCMSFGSVVILLTACACRVRPREPRGIQQRFLQHPLPACLRAGHRLRRSPASSHFCNTSFLPLHIVTPLFQCGHDSFTLRPSYRHILAPPSFSHLGATIWQHSTSLPNYAGPRPASTP